MIATLRIVVFVAVGLAGSAAADAEDGSAIERGITCLDAQSGRELWRADPNIPSQWLALQLQDSKLGLFELPDELATQEAEARRAYPFIGKFRLFDARTGKPLQPLPMKKEPFRGGIMVPLRGGLPGDWYLRPPGRPPVPLEGPIVNPTIIGNRIMFSLDDQPRAFGGEVYAYDFKTDRLTWQIDVWREVPWNLASSDVQVGITAYGDGVIVWANSMVFLVDARTGARRWSTPLPLVYPADSAVPQLFRQGRLVLIRFAEVLFMIDGESGQVLWQFRFGPAGNCFGVLTDKQVCTCFDDTVTRSPWDPDKPRPMRQLGLRTSALRIAVSTEKRCASSDQIETRFTDWRSAPEEKLFWSLKPPPPSKSDGAKLKLFLETVDRYPTLEHDVSAARDGPIYVKLPVLANRIRFECEGKVVRALERLAPDICLRSSTEKEPTCWEEVDPKTLPRRKKKT